MQRTLPLKWPHHLEPRSWYPINLLPVTPRTCLSQISKTYITLVIPKSERSTLLLAEKITAVETVYRLGKRGTQTDSESTPHKLSIGERAV